MHKAITKTILLFVLPILLIAWKQDDFKKEPVASAQDLWVDSIFNNMTIDQQIGQFFMIAAYSNKDEAHFVKIDSLIVNNHIGGLIFMQGGPLRQANLTNRYQSLAKIPLFISIDGEWGLSMRLDSTINFPKQMTLGALQDNSLIFKMGEEIGNQCKRMGIHINFAPVVDVNNNPTNPVIGYRAFGENKKDVAEKGSAYMKGMQSKGILACAKHFPGHGDTDADSHLSLPLIKHKKGRLEDIELYPFKELIKDSVASIMVAHLHIPAYDNSPNKPTTLSEYVVTKLLKNKLGFQGLIFTDALNMKGVSSFYKPGEADVQALLAGNDILLFSEDVPKAVQLIKQAMDEQKITTAEIATRVKKILKAKYWAGLNKYTKIDTKNLYNDLHLPKAYNIRKEIYENAITIVRNQEQILPIKHLDTLNVAAIHLGEDGPNEFSKTLSKYAKISHYYVSKNNLDSKVYDKIYEETAVKSLVIISFGGMTNQLAKNFKINLESLMLLNRLNARTKVVTVIFGNCYALRNFQTSKNIICTYEDNEVIKSTTAQIIFGAKIAKGKLPVSPIADFKVGDGLISEDLSRLKYNIAPQQVGMDEGILSKIDTIALKAIRDHAMPGCEILVVKDREVVYDKKFGFLTYDSNVVVNDSTLYDVASITKVAATLQAVMFLYSHQQICLDSTIGSYLPELSTTNKGNLIIKEVLSHQAGLQAFLEHWRKTVDHQEIKNFYYSKTKDSLFSFQVGDSLFGRKSLPDSVWKWTVQSGLLHRKDSCYHYKYSDVGFYLIQKVVERILNQPLDKFLYEMYRALGMYNSCFNPLQKLSKTNIAPTEIDKLFRRSEVRGTVHDQGAAMYKGIGGHAGLFSNANDLAILMQMNLQEGVYGGQVFYNEGTIRTFRMRHYTDNRRGIGWDKPEWSGGGPTSIYASQKTFGHTGFTGNCVWVDPKYNLVYIFLSNRTFPDVENKRLITQNIRTKIHDVIYESMLKYNSAATR